jgi:hypothetical protein
MDRRVTPGDDNGKSGLGTVSLTKGVALLGLKKDVEPD